MMRVLFGQQLNNNQENKVNNYKINNKSKELNKLNKNKKQLNYR